MAKLKSGEPPFHVRNPAINYENDREIFDSIGSITRVAIGDDGSIVVKGKGVDLGSTNFGKASVRRRV